MSSPFTIQDDIQLGLCSDVESLQQLVRTQQQLIKELSEQLTKSQKRIDQLESEIRELKKLKGKPKIRPSRLNTPKTKKQAKRAGSAKTSKKTSIEIHELRIIQPDDIPTDAKFNGYRDYDVQELKIERHNIRFRLAEYINSDGTTLVGQLPVEYGNGHYGPLLLGYILGFFA